jgi:hypothetical protein
METLQDWLGQLGPVANFTAIAVIFLLASIAGWYVGNWIHWLR